LKPPDNALYHSQLLYKTGHQLHFNAAFYSLRRDQSDSVYAQQK